MVWGVLTALLLSILFIICQVPAQARAKYQDTIYVLVIDQRTDSLTVAAAVAGWVCEQYPIKKVYWVPGSGITQEKVEDSFRRPKGCTVKLDKCLGNAVAEAYALLFAHTKATKVLLFLPSLVEPDEEDIKIISKLPYEGVVIYGLDEYGNQWKAPRM
ncbi:MAG: hypothetical protein Q8P77_00505 [Candidatus Veblenbacteria bacterium]|nr:hypothetical protein [Candidatus Veblenbacteria bacterium]